jgi:radical SAM superfamily enzyme YgiQ (UPF0313 family)
MEPIISLRDLVVDRLLAQVQTPAQYTGGEWNAVRKDRAAVRGTLCLAFPDLYSIGMSCHAIQVLYEVMNRRADWACERAFTPMPDMEQLLREHGLPLFSLESTTPLAAFDVLGFTLQYDLCYSNVLTMLDLGAVPLRADARTMDHPLVVAGGPCAANPEPMSRFIDLFVLGDGEEALPEVCDLWAELKRPFTKPRPPDAPGPTDDRGFAAGAAGDRGFAGGAIDDRGFVEDGDRSAVLAEMASRLPFAYCPRFYRQSNAGDGRPASIRPVREGLPAEIVPAVVADLDAIAPPQAPVVPFIECVQDRITIEIMRGCPGKCRFCQSTTLKRPLRFRKVETIVAAALAQYRTTGYNEISLLSLSSSDYPQFDELLRRLQETFRPLGVAVSLPSLRVNEELRLVGDLLNTDRHSGLTLAPEAARDEMRRRLGKPIQNEDLFAGCRRAFENGFSRVKLYFMCGLPGETESDLEGILEMSEAISRLGKDVSGRWATVVANVSNFVPKPQTPLQWHAMQRREYFHWAHEFLRGRNRFRSVQLRCHDVESSLLEGVLCRGDRRVGEAIELAWRRGARLDAWTEHLHPERWWPALDDAGIDADEILHQPYPAGAPLPWDHIQIRQGREYLHREHQRAGE